jgi:hypothetical protein
VAGADSKVVVNQGTVIPIRMAETGRVLVVAVEAAFNNSKVLYKGRTESGSRNGSGSRDSSGSGSGSSTRA